MRRFPRAAWLPLFLMAIPIASAQQRPLWEAGVGAAALSLPDYRGSDERRAYLLPLPFFVYRGDLFKVDREGVRARLFDDERIDIELSGAANFALRADRNQARAGMPKLRTMAEVGPELVYRLYGHPDRGALNLRLAARAAFAIGDGRVSSEGFTVTPSIQFASRNIGGSGFEGSVQWSALFADRRFHSYYYGVDSRYATADRPAYRASSGYAGMSLFAGMTRQFGDIWVGGYLRYDTLRGAAFEDSPLVRTRGYATAGIAAAYILGRSSTLVTPRF